MKKKKQAKQYKLKCQFCGADYKHSKTFSRFCSDRHRLYFFLKRKRVQEKIEKEMLKQVDVFGHFLKSWIKLDGVTAKKIMTKFLAQHQKIMKDLENQKMMAEDILIQKLADDRKNGKY